MKRVKTMLAAAAVAAIGCSVAAVSMGQSEKKRQGAQRRDSSEVAVKCVFMATPSDAELAGYSASEMKVTNSLGRVVVKGYIHVDASEAQSSSSAGGLTSIPAVASTNIAWNATNGRLEDGNGWYSKTESGD